jgi:WD40 repeat protein
VLCVAVMLLKQDSSYRIVSGSADKTIKIWNPINHQVSDSKHISSSCTKITNCDVTLFGHTEAVRCITVLPDNRIVSGSNDQTIKIWNPKTAKCDITFTGHAWHVNCVALLADGPSGCCFAAERIISSSTDNTFRIWNVQTGNCDNIFRNNGWLVLSIATFYDEYSRIEKIVSGSAGKKVNLWNYQTKSCDMTFRGRPISRRYRYSTYHSDRVVCVAILPDGRVVSGSHDCTIKIWNPRTGKCDSTFTGHDDIVNCVAAHSNGWIVSGSNDSTIKIWT